jgi:phosphoglycerate dehydrogenase-like enzyme
MKAVFASMNGQEILSRVYSPKTKTLLEGKLEFAPSFTNLGELDTRSEEWKQTELIFSTWGMPSLSPEQIEKYFPKLKAVFYAAGSVQYFARPFLDRGIKVFTAADANAVPVVEYTISAILLAAKGFFLSCGLYSSGNHEEARNVFSAYPGNFDTSIGILGAGKIGTSVVQHLKNFRLNVLIFDPFLSNERAASLGVKKVETLEEIFASSFIISNHLANNEQTQGMLNYKCFSLMKDNGVFINTGRGAQVVEADLVRALTEKPNRTALLDVTYPEPVPAGSPFFAMKNVFLTPHIAGSAGGEVARMGEYMADEYNRYVLSLPLKYEVTREMLATMA